MMKIVLYISLIVPIVLLGCQPLQIIHGLCYTDKTGTYLCPPPTSQQHEVLTSHEPKKHPELTCIEEQENGVFVDVCKGIELNRIYE